jgi:hypothetical protein
MVGFKERDTVAGLRLPQSGSELPHSRYAPRVLRAFLETDPQNS